MPNEKTEIHDGEKEMHNCVLLLLVVANLVVWVGLCSTF